MSTPITVTVADWVYLQIEERRGDLNRSEFVEECIRIGLEQIKKKGETNAKNKGN